MRSQDHFVTLREELDGIDEYLDIECVRFGPNLTVRKDITRDALDQLVPSMILQPIVENSLKHGLSGKVGGGQLTIHGYRHKGHVILEVVDNGTGMSAGAPGPGDRPRDWPAERKRAAPGDLRGHLSDPAAQHRGRGDVGAAGNSRAGRARTGLGIERLRRRSYNMDLKALVVDDEQLAREELCFLLAQVEGVEVVGQAGNGIEAIGLIEDLSPDVIFLDVQMPGMNGFEVARQMLGRESAAEIVFVTAYDQYAIEGFQVNAVDYLLKPVDMARLEQAVQRTRRRLQSDRPRPALANEDLERIVKLVTERQSRRERLAVKIGERVMLVDADDLIFASLADDVITVVAGNLTGTSNYRSLDELQERLDPSVFWRVHRSYLVNINKIKEIVPWFSRNYILKMNDGRTTEIPVSRSQTKRLREYLRL